MGGKTHNTAFTAMLQNKLHVSVARFTVPLLRTATKIFLKIHFEFTYFSLFLTYLELKR